MKELRNSSEYLQQQLVLSKPLFEVFRQVAEALPSGQTITTNDVILTIIQGDNIGAKSFKKVLFTTPLEEVVEYLKQNRESGVSLAENTIALNGTSCLADESVVETLIIASQNLVNSQNAISTVDFLIAEMSRKNSLLSEAFVKLSEIMVDSSTLQSMSPNRFKGEPGAMPAVLSYHESTYSAYSQQFASSSSDLGSAVSGDRAIVDGQAVTDLFRVAKDAGKKIITRDDVDDILFSLDNDPITVLVTNQPDEAAANVLSVAAAIAQDTSQTYKYYGCLALNQDALDSDPANAVFRIIAKSAKGGIVFIPSLDEYIQANGAVVNQIRQAITAKSLHFIVSASESGWLNLKKLRPFSTIQQPITILPPSAEKTVEIVTAMQTQIESDWKKSGFSLTLSAEAIEAAARYGSRYLTKYPQPEAAVTILKRAYSVRKLETSTVATGPKKRINAQPIIDVEDIKAAMKTLGFEVEADDPERYLHMKEILNQSIVGQDQALDSVTRVIRQAAAGGKDPRRPIGSFIFLGPSGVGKTELAHSLAKFLFDDSDALVELDMSEYSEKHNTARLIGSPPGYIGYEEGGQLTEAVRKKPYTIVLFDEVEKADPEVFNLLLQILGAGRLTDGHGRTIDFRNVVVIMTSNLGTEYYEAIDKLGQDGVKDAVMQEVKASFRPELLGRVSDTIVFNTLTTEAVRQIIGIQMKEINRLRAEERGITVELTPQMVSYLVKVGYSPQYGARYVRKAIDQYVFSDAFNMKILAKEFKPGNVVIADWDGQKTVYSKNNNGK